MSSDVYHERCSDARRKTLRLQNHDYAGGLYYITQATQQRQRFFGTLLNGRMRLSPAGQMIHDTWHDIPRVCPNYAVDAFIVMPDHIHGIVRVANDRIENDVTNDVGAPLRGHIHGIARVANDRIENDVTNDVGAPLRGRPQIRYHDYRSNKREREGVPTEGHPDNARFDNLRCDCATLFDFMHRFKSLTTARYRNGVIAQQWPRFDGRVWQREYYERIIRHDDAELNRIRDYIRNNPANANLLRFGALRHIGNSALLNLRKTAFLASRSCPEDGAHGVALQQRDIEVDIKHILMRAHCVISGFLSPLERTALRFCRACNIPTIHVLACGHVADQTFDERSLVLTPFGPDIATVNAARAAWCNQYALEHADEIVIGQLDPAGMLAFQLTDMPIDKPVTNLSACPCVDTLR